MSVRHEEGARPGRGPGSSTCFVEVGFLSALHIAAETLTTGTTSAYRADQLSRSEHLASRFYLYNLDFYKQSIIVFAYPSLEVEVLVTPHLLGKL